MAKNGKTAGYTRTESFFRGIIRDFAVVRYAITHKESNGLVEGIINKIKLIKRTMYGRCSFELLRIKVLAS